MEDKESEVDKYGLTPEEHRRLGAALEEKIERDKERHRFYMKYASVEHRVLDAKGIEEHNRRLRKYTRRE